MNSSEDYDVFVVPSFTLDTNYNYDIKLVVSKELDNKELFTKFEELAIEEDTYFNATNKLLYYCSLSCLVDIKKWLLKLTNLFNEFSIRSNLDNKLLDKAKELKK
jgi:hypothetical protein